MFDIFIQSFTCTWIISSIEAHIISISCHFIHNDSFYTCTTSIISISISIRIISCSYLKYIYIYTTIYISSTSAFIISTGTSNDDIFIRNSSANTSSSTSTSNHDIFGRDSSEITHCPSKGQRFYRRMIH